MDREDQPDAAWSRLDDDTEWWPALPQCVSPPAHDAGVDLPQTASGGMARVRAAVPLLNARPVARGTHHDVDDPIPITLTLRWATGAEEVTTVALRRTRVLVRVRIAELRVMTGAVWVPAKT